MKLLKKITDKDLGHREKKNVKYRTRRAARAIVFDKKNKNKIAILYVSKSKFHKLPGGGLKKGEDIEGGLKREVFEETGCLIDIVDEVGMTEEHRSGYGIHQFSYCFIANVKRKYKKPRFTEKEKAYGFQLKWIDLDNAIKLLEKDLPSVYGPDFVLKRDLIFLKQIKQDSRH